MPLKIKGNQKGDLSLTWTSLDNAMEATWRIPANTEEEEALEILTKAVTFVREQRGEIERGIQEVQTFLMHDSLADLSGSISARPSASPTSPPPNAQRIPMTPSRSDLPAGGAPVMGWANVGGTTGGAPALPDHAAKNGWEMIPPGEM